MTTFTKRIAVLWTADALKDNNGVYHFHRALLKLAQKNNWQVDLLFDKETTGKGKRIYADLTDLGANVRFPKKPYTDLVSDYYSFRQGVSAIELANMQLCLFEALQENLYDFVIGVPLFLNMVPLLCGINIPTIWYTHNPSSVDGDFGSDSYYLPALETFIDHMSQDCIVATQTQTNVEVLAKRGIQAQCLPLPFPDLEQFNTVTVPKSGILFCGTVEDRKQFNKFLDLIVATKIPAKVMTSKTSAVKMEEMFKKAGVTDYDIRHNIHGNEKRDFFASSKIFFMPSNNESFGYAFAEAIPHCHAVAFDYPWTNNFDRNFCHIIPNNSKYIEYVAELYYSDKPIPDGSLEYILGMQTAAETAWTTFINQTKLDAGKHTKSFIDTHRNFWIKDLKKLIKRPHVSLDEIIPLLNRKSATIIYTKTDTWFSLDNVPPGEVEVTPFDTLFG